MRRAANALLLIAALQLAAAAAGAQEPAAKPAADPANPQTLFELLDAVQKGLEVEREENRRRVQEFQRQQAEQERLLAEARATLASEEATSQALETRYNENEAALGEGEARLTERLGQLGELFGVVRQVATDTGANVWDSLTSSQLGPRKELLDRLGRSKELPSTEDLEKLWYELQREMTEQGQVVRYQAPVLTIEGKVEQKEVIRAGPFSAVADGRYLLWEPAEGKLRELTRQPPTRYVNTVESTP
jgi:biopolymer transport protein ExbB